jgi:NAD(P)-dependent dehydrogenase (short-subunit alcohol dehydrogenase family)
MKTAFITGTSSGLGYGLAQCLSEQGWTIYGCSRRGCDLPGVHDQRCDLLNHETLPAVLQGLLENVSSLDLIALNAGILGKIKQLTQTSRGELEQIMAVNVWANKLIMDWLYEWERPIDQIIMISSGAAVLGNKGWSGYALSKSTLNMLARLYSHEFTHTHITAVAPGIIDTAMMDYLCEEADAEAFPALQRIQQARGTAAMPKPLDAARRLVSVLPRLKDWPSGSFVDIREILDPEGYAKLYGKSDQRS